MFKTASDLRDYIKTTLKSKKACSNPSQASIWRTYCSKKFHPVANTYCPGGEGIPYPGTGTVTWKYAQTPSTNHKFCAFCLVYDDKIFNKCVTAFLHLEFDDTTIYNVGVELMKGSIQNCITWIADDNRIIPHLLSIF